MNSNTIQLFAAALTGLAVTSTQAASILINDAGFEDDVFTANMFSGGNFDFTAWEEDRTNSSLTFVANGSGFAPFGIPGPKTGDQYAFLHANGNQNNLTGSSFLSQDTPLLWSVLSVGDTLTAKVWTTYRSDLPGDADTTFSFNAADGSGITSDAIDVTVGTTAGVWAEQTWSYVVTQSDLDAAALGSWGAVNLQIGITQTTTAQQPNDPRQVAFDDVSLEYTAIPEPGSLALIGIGGLLFLRRRLG
ncbi:MAG: PEP-CTERM sorting domain-containing protein [Planctomycetota bacterium]